MNKFSDEDRFNEVISLQKVFIDDLIKATIEWNSFKLLRRTYLEHPTIAKYAKSVGESHAEMLAYMLIRRCGSAWSIASALKPLLGTEDYLGPQLASYLLCRSIVEQSSKIYWSIAPITLQNKELHVFTIGSGLDMDLHIVLKRLIRMDLIELESGVRHLSNSEQSAQYVEMKIIQKLALKIFGHVDFRHEDWIIPFKSGAKPINDQRWPKPSGVTEQYFEACKDSLFGLDDPSAGYGILSFFSHSPHFLQREYSTTKTENGTTRLIPQASLDTLDASYIAMMMLIQITFLTLGILGEEVEPFNELLLKFNLARNQLPH